MTQIYWIAILSNDVSRPGTVGVTGATGLVGTAVCRELTRRGWTVVPLVRTAAGLSGERVIGDLDQSRHSQSYFAGLDAIVHTAARVHVMRDTAADPLEAFRRVNVLGTLSLARAACDAGVARFIFVSSVKVNGECTAPGRPFLATDPPAPADAYGLSKLQAEQGLADVAATCGLELVIIRPVLIYGPNVKANFRALMALVRRAVPLPFGRIANRRSLLFVGNMADLVATCLTHQAAPGRVFLAADEGSVSTPDLARALARAQGRKARLLSVPVRWLSLMARLFGKEAVIQRLVENLEVDIGEANRILGWQPPFSLAEGLAATVERSSAVPA